MKEKQITFEYTDEFLKHVKYLKLLGYLKFGLFCLVLWCLTELTKNMPRPPLVVAIILLITFLFMFFMVIIRVLGENTHDYSHDLIYIEGGLLHYRKCYKTRMGTSYAALMVKDITGVEPGAKKIKISGNIVFNNGVMTRVFKQITLPAALKNRDQLIKFLQSKLESAERPEGSNN